MGDPKFEDVTFTVTCTMKRRWAEQFIGMLKYMERLGGIGASRTTTFFADGDGDFRPKFKVPDDIQPSSPLREKDYETYWDAG